MHFAPHPPPSKHARVLWVLVAVCVEWHANILVQIVAPREGDLAAGDPPYHSAFIYEEVHPNEAGSDVIAAAIIGSAKAAGLLPGLAQSDAAAKGASGISQ